MRKLLLAILCMALLSVSPAFAATIQATNLGDTWINEVSPTANYGTDVTATIQGTASNQKYFMVKYDLTSIPPVSSITNAQACWYLDSNGLSGANTINVTSHLLYQNYTCGGIPWTESCPTWNTRPNATLGQYNQTFSSSYLFGVGSALGWYCWDVTANVQRSYSQGYRNTSVYYLTASSVNSQLAFRTKENANTATRPYLNITYVSADTTPPTWSLNSTNSTGIGGLAVLHSVFWQDNAVLSKYVFSTNVTGAWVNDTAQNFTGGWVNVTKTAPLSGVVGWQVFANDTSSNSNATPIFTYTVYPLDLNVTYPSEVNETGNYSIVANYTLNGIHVPNGTVTLCYTFTSTQCFNMTEGVDTYYWNFTYNHDIGGLIQFNVTANHVSYPPITKVFYITFFDKVIGVRFWSDLNMTTPYINQFLWVYAKPRCDIFDQLLYFGLYDTCNVSAYHGEYVNGVANISIWTPNTYDLYVVDGSVFWNCTSCEPVVTKYSVWTKFDTIAVTSAGYETMDYYWNTTAFGNIPFFGNFDWDFWLSVAGIVILIIAAALCAYFTENGIATLFIIILVYILLKLFHILTGAIFFGLF